MRRTNGTGCVYKRPDSPVWWLKYSLRGKAFRESSHQTDIGKAEKMLRKRLGELDAGTFAGPQVERIKVQELAEDFFRDYRINGRRSLNDVQARWTLHLEPFFGYLRAADVTSQQIARYVDSRQQEGASNATVNRELAALKRMFRLGVQATPAKVLRMPAFPHMRENNVRKGFLEDDQFHALVADAEL